MKLLLYKYISIYKYKSYEGLQLASSLQISVRRITWYFGLRHKYKVNWDIICFNYYYYFLKKSKLPSNL